MALKLSVNQKHQLKTLFSPDNIGVLILSFFLLFLLVFYLSRSDIRIHVLHVKKINLGEADYPPTILFYMLINLLSLFSKSIGILKLVTVFVLSLSVTAKYIISKHIIKEFLAGRKIESKNIGKYITMAAFALLFLFAIPDYYNVFVLEQYYLGRVVPNVWHNSTLIFLMPFALALFWQQYKVLNGLVSPTNKYLFGVSILIIINLLIKPSFFFVFAPVTLLFLWHKYGFSSSFLRNIFPVVIGIIVLLAQYIIIYYFQYGYLSEEDSHIALSNPFKLWAEFIPAWYIPLALIISYLLPILYYTSYIRKYNDLELLDKYTIAMSLLGLLVSIFVVEEGPRFLHANFFWQNIVCSYLITMIVTMYILVRIFKGGWKGWKLKTLSTVFVLQFISGIGYIVYMLINNNYY